MIFKAFTFAVLVAAVSARDFEQCLQEVCEKFKNGELSQDSSAVAALKKIGYDLKSCQFLPSTPDSKFPFCDGPDEPYDVTITCAKKDDDGNYETPKCFSGTMGIDDDDKTCENVMASLNGFIDDSLQKCDADGRRRRRNASAPGFNFSFR